MSAKKHAFIVGASRSGTTLLMRMLNNHSQVTAFSEIHYYDELLPRFENNPPYLTAWITARAKGGYHAKPNEFDPSHDAKEYSQILDKLTPSPIWVEKTPQYAFHLEELFSNHRSPEVFVVIRDPRDVMASQKNKWRRSALGAAHITWKESLRLRVNYHPWLSSKLWKSTYNSVDASPHKKHIHYIKYEELTNNPDKVLAEVCNTLQVSFEKPMLDVPKASSSHESDSNSRGMRNSAPKWSSHLTSTEVYFIESNCADLMVKHDYTLSKPSQPKLGAIWQWLRLAMKAPFIFLLNTHRLHKPWQTIAKRWK